MIFVLPPSETKREGGITGTKLDFAALSYPSLSGRRRTLVAAVKRLARDPAASMTALKIGPRLVAEVERNRTLSSSATLPALARYTGVLYDPIDAARLDDEAWAWAGKHIVIHSALFGLVSATDPIPAYRFSHDSRVSDVRLGEHWRVGISRVLDAHGGVVVDLRSDGYADLGPAAASITVRVVSDSDGRRRALNHFNKKSKGLLVAALLRDRPQLEFVADLVEWASSRGIVLERVGQDLVLISESLEHL